MSGLFTIALGPTCPPLTAPDNGMINCLLGEDGEANPGDTCTFTCEDGYELGGSTFRTCQNDGSWSGTDATCTVEGIIILQGNLCLIICIF